jgi:hypothetical protein
VADTGGRRAEVWDVSAVADTCGRGAEVWDMSAVADTCGIRAEVWDMSATDERVALVASSASGSTQRAEKDNINMLINIDNHLNNCKSKIKLLNLYFKSSGFLEFSGIPQNIPQTVKIKLLNLYFIKLSGLLRFLDVPINSGQSY